MQEIQIRIFLIKSLLFFIGGTIIGLIILQFFESPIKENVWFWFFSTIAQVYAAILSLVFISYYTQRSISITTGLPKLNNLTENLTETTTNLTKIILNLSKTSKKQVTEADKKAHIDAEKVYINDKNAFDTFSKSFSNELENFRCETINYTIIIGFILLTSVILLPLGSLNTCNETISNFLLKYNLTNNKLDFVLIAGFTCFCISNTYMFLSDLIAKRQTDPTTEHPLIRQPNKNNKKSSNQKR